MKKFLILLIIIFLVGCEKNNNEINISEDKVEQQEEIIEEVPEKQPTKDDYISNKVNELGEVPIMMYHGIHNKKNDETNYIGGNVDKDGYQRTSEAFIKDLEYYYQNGYRMIRLTDYVDGKIDVELGKSPIVLTFDDGLTNNLKVNGINENGEIIIDPNCAIGILESFKVKYPDYNVTATFFINGGLFGQPEYNEQIINWLVDNGYDIGNHTYSHVDFTKVNSAKSSEEVGKLYEILDRIIPDRYVNIIALPFGSPYSFNHENMEYILNSVHNNKEYITKAALRVGWKAESSPFSNEFNSKFLKRIRAYDNNGKDFDIEMNFKLLENNKYISDGSVENIVIPEDQLNLINKLYTKQLITY